MQGALKAITEKAIPEISRYLALTYGGPNVTNPANYEAFRDVAVDVLKTQNLAAISSLKKFLAALPSPSYISRVLLEAIYRLAQQDVAACRWVIQHRRLLEPELDLDRVAQNLVRQRLQNQGLLLDQDFSFTAEGQLQGGAALKAWLLAEATAGERVLLEEILQIR
jgi:hypothetical protein